MKSRFCIIHVTGRRLLSRWFTIEAPTFKDAYEQVMKNNPGWEISCAWPV
jgi:hypothetical protein